MHLGMVIFAPLWNNAYLRCRSNEKWDHHAQSSLNVFENILTDKANLLLKGKPFLELER